MTIDARTQARGDLEREVRALCDAGNHDVASTRTINAYGPEILGLLKARLGSEADAADAFSLFCEDLWRGIAGFAWRCSLRVWAYTVARHAELRFATAPQRRPERNLALSESTPPSAAVASPRSRTGTAPYQRTDVKSRFRALRARLGEEDQLILVLRVDRGLGWSDIAQVLAGPTAAPAAGALAREETRIRKRFQIIKERLRTWAASEGLLDGTRG